MVYLECARVRSGDRIPLWGDMCYHKRSYAALLQSMCQLSLLTGTLEIVLLTYLLTTHHGMVKWLLALTADWRRQLGRPRITWLSTVQQDLKQHHLMLPEAADLAQNRPLWRMMSTYGATQSWVACQKRRQRIVINGDSASILTWLWRHSFRRATDDCIAPYVDIILHRRRFWAKFAASGSERW